MPVALQQLLTLMTEEQARGVRLGYVLGYHQAQHGQDEEVGESSAEHRFLTEMRLIEPELR